MSALQPGEVVNVTIKDVRVHSQDEHGCVTVVADAHDGGAGHWPMPPQAAFERVGPAEWPPREDDVWHDYAGIAWFAVRLETNAAPILLMNSRGTKGTPDEIADYHGPMRLAFRHEDDGKQWKRVTCR